MAHPSLRAFLKAPPLHAGEVGEGNRRVANGDQVDRVATLAMKRKPSVDFAGYWQRHVRATSSAVFHIIPAPALRKRGNV